MRDFTLGGPRYVNSDLRADLNLVPGQISLEFGMPGICEHGVVKKFLPICFRNP